MPRQRPLILVVDACEQDAQQACDIFALTNYEAVAAHSMQQAAELVAGTAFDVALINLELPGGGFACSAQLRALPNFSEVPVAFSTAAEYDFALLMEAQFYGGLFLHRKPYVDSELLAQVSTMVRIKQLQDELHKRMAELDRLASTDALTGLYNRRFFYQRMEEELARAGRIKSPLCLAFLDLDYFKQINDSYGHHAGDEVLKQTARIMSRILRKSDILGRVGGEEFLILLPDTDSKGGFRLAERLRLRIEAASYQSGEEDIPVTISIGVFYAPDPIVLGVDELVLRADAALYEAKESGRNRVVLHGHEIPQPQDAPSTTAGV